MNKKVIIIASTEKLCAYLLNSSNNVRLASDIKPINIMLNNISPKTTDISDYGGRHQGGNHEFSNPSRQTESQGGVIEKNLSLLDSMAITICDVIAHEKPDSWNLAAPAELSGQLFERLPIDVLKKLTTLKRADYTKLSIKTVERVFSS